MLPKYMKINAEDWNMILHKNMSTWFGELLSLPPRTFCNRCPICTVSLLTIQATAWMYATLIMPLEFCFATYMAHIRTHLDRIETVDELGRVAPHYEGTYVALLA